MRKRILTKKEELPLGFRSSLRNGIESAKRWLLDNKQFIMGAGLVAAAMAAMSKASYEKGRKDKTKDTADLINKSYEEIKNKNKYESAYNDTISKRTQGHSRSFKDELARSATKAVMRKQLEEMEAEDKNPNWKQRKSDDLANWFFKNFRMS